MVQESYTLSTLVTKNGISMWLEAPLVEGLEPVVSLHWGEEEKE